MVYCSTLYASFDGQENAQFHIPLYFFSTKHTLWYSHIVCDNVVILLFIRSDFCSVFIQIFFKTAASFGVLRVVFAKGTDKHTLNK